MLKNSFKDYFISEPLSPGAMERLTLNEKRWLHASRLLKQGMEEQDEDKINQALSELGYHAEEFKDNPPCDCSPIVLEWEDGGKNHRKLTSNFLALKIYPNGTLYQCVDCGDKTLSLEPPNALSQAQDKARFDFPDPNQGSDISILPNPNQV